MKKRKVYPGRMHHIYQRTRHGGLLFYSPADCLVFFTVFCSVAERMGISVAALCLMPDHVHQVVVAPNARTLSSFQQRFSQLFAKEWNRSRKRKGQVFRHCFGSAAKLGAKQIRTTLAYNYNNPVERKLTDRAEQYLWNFLPYASSRHPFSAPLAEEHASRALRRALQEARACQKAGGYLRYGQLDRWFRDLNPEEAKQLTDVVIGLWNSVDYALAASFYESREAMIRAFHDNSGSEYDIREERDNWDDKVYRDISSILLREKHIDSLRDIPGLPDPRKGELFRLLRYRTSAHPRQLCKYLHWHLSE